MDNMRSPESYLRDVLPNDPKSVLDVGVGLSGVFYFSEWEKRDLKLKVCIDISDIRTDIPNTWKKIITDGINIPYDDNTFDVVMCCNVVEHVAPEKWDMFINELLRVSQDLVYITTNNLAKTKSPNIKFFVDHKFRILFLDQNHTITFRRKIPSWVSRFYDMEDYVRSIGMLENTKSILDVGTGNKGVVAQNYYEEEVHINRGYACDIWTLRKLSPVWKPLKINALNLFDILGQRSVDIVQAFGFLEHLKKSDGYKFLHIAERIAKKAVIISAASFVHGMSPDEKAAMDGNPYHHYHSVWHWKEFERLGYKSNYEHMRSGMSFSEEAIAWKILDA